ncbi:MAG: glycoside hydrolase family 11 protein [Polyangiaceae bacterium]|nr:glycoside hydrolase family 11 protein [Polyangiaceae bacterium]
MYGWTTNPCIEWYIVDDSYNNMPVNPGNTQNKGTVEIDGGSYIMHTRQTTGTGGSRCSGVSSWTQYYSVRTTARDCGVISLTQHFDAWAGLGMPLGNLLEAKILVETGGGSGSVNCPVANVMTTQ